VRPGAMEGAKLYTVAYPPHEEVTGFLEKSFHDVQLGGGAECGGYVLLSERSRGCLCGCVVVGGCAEMGLGRCLTRGERRKKFPDAL